MVSTDLFHIVYCSRNRTAAQQGYPAAEMQEILAASRANNAREGVTGALLYSEGCFVQVLEGMLEAVQRTFGRIQCDPRHGDVIVLRAGPIQERLFAAWDMALADPTVPAKARVSISALLAQPDEAAGVEVVALLEGLVRREAEWVHAAE